MAFVTEVARRVFTLLCYFEDSWLVIVLEKPAIFVLQLNDLLLFKVHQSETYFFMDSLSGTLQYQICCHLVQSSRGEGQLLEDAKCELFRTTQHQTIIEMKVCQNSQCKVVEHTVVSLMALWYSWATE